MSAPQNYTPSLAWKTCTSMEQVLEDFEPDTTAYMQAVQIFARPSTNSVNILVEVD